MNKCLRYIRNRLQFDSSSVNGTPVVLDKLERRRVKYRCARRFLICVIIIS